MQKLLTKSVNDVSIMTNPSGFNDKLLLVVRTVTCSIIGSTTQADFRLWLLLHVMWFLFRQPILVLRAAYTSNIFE